MMKIERMCRPAHPLYFHLPKTHDALASTSTDETE
ncbi:hypothetical protein Krac_4481 [Ktedonobacter racemifer DSM 44963]|uniref:Uncharacterized protein n=1 Tax=Ktedonobacter racemifer DSM 44963 TaxID=485913 RepID=D6TSV9_KTERA|nr:hypothetical protein Krac_4481 [Ktedonobacter racemifer DSM 44963]